MPIYAAQDEPAVFACHLNKLEEQSFLLVYLTLCQEEDPTRADRHNASSLKDENPAYPAIPVQRNEQVARNNDKVATPRDQVGSKTASQAKIADQDAHS